MRNTIGLIFMLMFFTASCQINIAADNYDHHKLSFQELPSVVQEQFIYNLSPIVKDDGFVLSGGTRYQIVNLDSNFVNMKFEDTTHDGVSPGNKIFLIGQTKFILPWNNYKENPPFILHEKFLYYISTIDSSTEKEIKKAPYARIDLSQHLNY